MRFFCFSLLLVLIVSCNNTDVNRTKLIHYTPQNASIILRTNNIESLKSSINNSDFFEIISNTAAYNNIKDKLENLSYLKPTGDILISFSKDKTDSLQYTI
ncbi:MAG: ribonuclease HII, partial [Flavobacteriales bacterium]